MRTNRLPLLTLLAFTWPCCVAGAAELAAGTARIDVTPPPEFKAALGGYGERMSRPAQGVHDRVFAKALVLSSGSRRNVIVTADVLGFPPAFKPALVERLSDQDWPSTEIMLLPSHSHTSIEMNAINPKNIFGIKQIGVYDPRLFTWLVERFAEVIRTAAQELVPVDVGTTSATLEGWNRNRRQRDGVVDSTLTVTRIDTLEGSPLAILVNFTAHPTFMGAKHMLFSGGWPGHLQRTLEAVIGQGVNVMYFNGAEGDQSPVPQSDSGSSRWETAQQYGTGLAMQAHRVWTGIVPQRMVDYALHQQKISLPENRWHPDFMTTGGDEYGLSEILLRQMLPLMFPRNTTSTSLHIGDLVIVGIPGEMTAELGLEVKRRVHDELGAPHVAIGGLADEWISYILSAEEYQRGGYESSVSFYGAELGRTIVEGAVAGARALREGPR